MKIIFCILVASISQMVTLNSLNATSAEGYMTFGIWWLIAQGIYDGYLSKTFK